MDAMQALYYEAFSAALIQIFFSLNFCESLLILATPSMRVSEKAMLESLESVKILGSIIMGKVRLKIELKLLNILMLDGEAF